MGDKMSTKQEDFEQKFPSLKDQECIKAAHPDIPQQMHTDKDYIDCFSYLVIQEHCLDKEKVKAAIRKQMVPINKLVPDRELTDKEMMHIHINWAMTNLLRELGFLNKK